MNTFRQLLGSELPIIQAPMAGAQGSALAIAVANAGGVGSLPCAMLSPTQVRTEVAAICAQTDRPYCVNFFCHKQPIPDVAREAAWRDLLSPYYAEFGVPKPTGAPAIASRKPFDADSVAIIEEFRPPIVSFHFGLPGPDLLKRVKTSGAIVLGCATTVDEARWLEQRGVDGVIAQGLEAGGHRGMFLSKDLNTQSGTFALVRRVVKAVDVPVIATGGIVDAAGVRAARDLGAAAVQVGTAYLMCPESRTSAVHRAALCRASVEPTFLTNLFSGAPARGLLNRLIREIGPMNSLAPEFPLASAALAPLRIAAEKLCDDAFSPLWCGQNASGCAEIPAAELTRMLAG